MLIVSEVFGPTFQGEGPSAGQLATFVRLGLCNLDCSWCDTQYTWDWTGKNGPPQNRSLLRHTAVEDVAGDLIERGAPLVVITGGEPLVQAKRLVDLVGLLEDAGLRVEVETNGTLAPPAGLEDVDWNVSPKLAGSGVDRVHLDQAVANFAGRPRARFKFVVTGQADLNEVDALVLSAGLDPSVVWVMPEGRSAADIVARGPWLAEGALVRHYNFTTRLHVLLWGDERAR